MIIFSNVIHKNHIRYRVNHGINSLISYEFRICCVTPELLGYDLQRIISFNWMD